MSNKQNIIKIISYQESVEKIRFILDYELFTFALLYGFLIGNKNSDVSLLSQRCITFEPEMYHF